MLTRIFRTSLVFASILIINSVSLALSQQTPAPSKTPAQSQQTPAPSKTPAQSQQTPAPSKTPAQSQQTPAPSKTPAQGNTAYVCDSEIGGKIRKVGPLHHTSVAICPAGEKPTIDQNGTSVNNPKCTYYGTQPFLQEFQVESDRQGVSYKPAQAPASVVQERVNSFHKEWNLITNNCQQAANEVTTTKEVTTTNKVTTTKAPCRPTHFAPSARFD